jgi:hypothetical protein
MVITDDAIEVAHAAANRWTGIGGLASHIPYIFICLQLVYHQNRLTEF